MGGQATSDDGLLFPPIAQATTTQVAHLLISHVRSGRLQPGDKLPTQRELARRLGVGMSAVREALAAMDLLGIVSTRQGDGTYLTSSTSALLPDTLEWGLMLGKPETFDLIDARAQLEVMMAGLAAERATPESLVELRESFARMQALPGESSEFVAADVAFHLALARSTRNGVLSNMLSSIRSLLDVWIRRSIDADDGSTVNTLQEHEAVLLAIEARDHAGATAAMEEHMRRASARLRVSLDHEGLDRA